MEHISVQINPTLIKIDTISYMKNQLLNKLSTENLYLKITTIH